MLAGLQFKTCVIYLDDILVYGEGIDIRSENLGTISSKLRDAGWKLRPEKCFFKKKRVNI